MGKGGASRIGGSPNKNFREKETLTNKMQRSRSRSPRHGGSFFMDDVPERGETVKMYNKEANEDSQPPAWYKTLKRQIGK